MKKMMILCLITALSGCALFETKAETAGAAFVDCTKGDVASIVASILASVATTVSAGGAGWESSLETIGKSAGSDALACAVKSVETVLSAGAGSGMATAALSPGAIRAESFLQGHGIKFAQ